MDLTHLHLMLNHLPVVGVIFGFLILLWGFLRGYEEVKNVGLVILIFTAAAAVPVYLTGEPAEEAVENLPGVAEQIIEIHESSALLSLILAIVTGAGALAALILKQLSFVAIARFSGIAVLLLSFVTGAFMARTANLGGQIRHTEIRGSAPAGNPAGNNNPREAEAEDDD